MDVVEIWRKQHAIAVKHVFTVDISQEQNNARMSLSGLAGHKCGMTRWFKELSSFVENANDITFVENISVYG